MVISRSAWSHRPDAGALPVLAGLTLLAIVPLWSSRYLPMVDLPHHLGLISILDRLDDPELPFATFFAIRPGFTPYLGYYWLLHLLAYVIPLEAANRLVLSAYVVGLAWGTAGLASALGRSRWLALLALPLAFTFEFYMGFVSHLASLALAAGSLATHAAMLRGRLAGPGWALLAVALPLACLVTHVQPYAFFVAGLAVMLILFPGRRVRSLLTVTPSLALFLAWILPIASGRSGGPSLTALLTSDPFAGRIAAIGGYLFDPFRDPLDGILYAGFGLTWLWAMSASLRERSRSLGRAESWAPILLAASAIGGYLVMPSHAALMQYIHHRYATMTALMLAVAVPLPPGGAPRAWRAALAALCAILTVYLIVQFARFDREAGDFAALAERMEAGSCVAPILTPHATGVMRDPRVYEGFAGYLTLWRGAVAGGSFAVTRHSPLVLRARDGTIAAAVREAALPDIRDQRRHIRLGTLHAAYGGFYRYFLIARGGDVTALFGAGAEQLVKVGESGPLALYLNPDADCGAAVASRRRPRQSAHRRSSAAAPGWESAFGITETGVAGPWSARRSSTYAPAGSGEQSERLMESGPRRGMPADEACRPSREDEAHGRRGHGCLDHRAREDRPDGDQPREARAHQRRDHLEGAREKDPEPHDLAPVDSREVEADQHEKERQGQERFGLEEALPQVPAGPREEDADDRDEDEHDRSRPQAEREVPEVLHDPDPVRALSFDVEVARRLQQLQEVGERIVPEKGEHEGVSREEGRGRSQHECEGRRCGETAPGQGPGDEGGEDGGHRERQRFEEEQEVERQPEEDSVDRSSRARRAGLQPQRQQDEGGSGGVQDGKKRDPPRREQVQSRTEERGAAVPRELQDDLVEQQGAKARESQDQQRERTGGLGEDPENVEEDDLAGHVAPRVGRERRSELLPALYQLERAVSERGAVEGVGPVAHDDLRHRGGGPDPQRRLDHEAAREPCQNRQGLPPCGDPRRGAEKGDRESDSRCRREGALERHRADAGVGPSPLG